MNNSIDLRNKPEGATHFHGDTYYRIENKWQYYNEAHKEWLPSVAGSEFHVHKLLPIEDKIINSYTHRQYIGDLLKLPDECLKRLGREKMILNREIAHRYANGEDIQVYMSLPEGWVDVGENLFIRPPEDYRIKPRTIKGEIEVPHVSGMAIDGLSIKLVFESNETAEKFKSSITKLLAEK